MTSKKIVEMEHRKYNPVPELHKEAIRRSKGDTDEAKLAYKPPRFNKKLYLNEGANYISTILDNGIKYESRPKIEHRDLNEYDDGRNIAWLNMIKARMNVSEYLFEPDSIIQVPSRTASNVPRMYRATNLVVS
jgi:hypothetical protein